jgi:hypothetical protein
MDSLQVMLFQLINYVYFICSLFKASVSKWRSHSVEWYSSAFRASWHDARNFGFNQIFKPPLPIYFDWSKHVFIINWILLVPGQSGEQKKKIIL